MQAKLLGDGGPTLHAIVAARPIVLFLTMLAWLCSPVSGQAGTTADRPRDPYTITADPSGDVFLRSSARSQPAQAAIQPPVASNRAIKQQRPADRSTFGIVTASTEETAARALYGKAAEHFSAGRWQESASGFERLLDTHPLDPLAIEARFFLGKAYLELGQAANAGICFRTYLQQQPAGRLAPAARYRVGEVYYLLGNAKEAERSLIAFLREYPDDPHVEFALPHLGDLAIRRGDHPAAEAHFRQALANFPDSTFLSDCQYGLAQSYFQRGRADLARPLLEKVAGSDPPAGTEPSPLADDAQFYLGACDYEMGQLERAVKSLQPFESRLRESPWRGDAAMVRGWALLRLGQLEPASEAFHTARDVPRYIVEAKYWLGVTLCRLKRWDEALETLLAAERIAASRRHRLLDDIRHHAADAARHAGDSATADRLYNLLLEDERFESLTDDLSGSADDASPSPPTEAAASPDAQPIESVETVRPSQPSEGTAPIQAANHPPEPTTPVNYYGWQDEALLGKIEAAADRGDLDALRQAAIAFTSLFPDSPHGHAVQRARAAALLRAGRRPEAIVVLSQLVTHTEADAEKWPHGCGCEPTEHHRDRLRLGRVLLEADRYDDAVATVAPIADAGNDATHGDLFRREATMIAAVGLFQNGKPAAALRRLDTISPSASEPQVSSRAPHEPFLPQTLRNRVGGDTAEAITAMRILCLCQLGQFGQAEQDLFAMSEYLKSQAGNSALCRAEATATEAVARLALEAGDIPRAADLFNMLRTRTADARGRQTATIGLSRCLTEAGRHEDADGLLANLLSQDLPIDVRVEASLLRARGLHRRGRTDAALAVLDPLLTGTDGDDPPVGEVLLAAGRWNFELKRLPTADRHLDQFLRSFPHHPGRAEALVLRGQIATRSGRNSEATDFFERAAAEFAGGPDARQAKIHLARLALNERRYDQAQRLAVEMLATKTSDGETVPDEAELLFIAGRALVGQDQFDAAAEIFRRLVTRFPDNATRHEADFWIAEADFRAGRYMQASVRLTNLDHRLLGREHHLHGLVRLRRAQIAAHQELPDEALRLARSIPEDFPRFSQPHETDYVIGRALLDLRQYEPARESFRRAIRQSERTDPSVASLARWHVAQSYVAQREFDAAIEQYRYLARSAAGPQWRSAALSELARCYEVIGRRTDAEVRIASAASSPPGAARPASADRSTIPVSRARSVGTGNN